jgi:hypothetical protein
MSKTNKIRSLNVLETSLLSIILVLILGGIFLGYHYTNNLRKDITKVEGLVESLNSSQIVSTVQQVQSIIDNFCTNGINIQKGQIWNTKLMGNSINVPGENLIVGGKNSGSIGSNICEKKN